MWLLNASRKKLEFFQCRKIPKYAILSHRWEEEESPFQDVVAGTGTEKKGYVKILQCCKKVLELQLEYVWVDKCCIDKSSSAELSEVINSMYNWYKRASVCLAYLSDVSASAALRTGFSKSAWFARGWTLQEPLAPSNLIIFDGDWIKIGTKTDGRIAKRITEVTGVPFAALRHFMP